MNNVSILDKKNEIVDVKKNSPEEMDGKISDEDIFKEEYKLINENFLIAKGTVKNINGEYFDLEIKYKEGECDFIFKDKELISFKIKSDVLVKKLEKIADGGNSYSKMNIADIKAGDLVQVYFEKDYSGGLISSGIKVIGENIE